MFDSKQGTTPTLRSVACVSVPPVTFSRRLKRYSTIYSNIPVDQLAGRFPWVFRDSEVKGLHPFGCSPLLRTVNVFAARGAAIAGGPR